MGGQESKITKPTANVVNTVDVIEKQNDPSIYLIIIIIILAAQFATVLCQMHRRSIKKNVIRSTSLANQLDKV